jgi:hypothetical protein
VEVQDTNPPTLLLLLLLSLLVCVG